MFWEMVELPSVSVEGQEVGRRSRDTHSSSEAFYYRQRTENWGAVPGCHQCWPGMRG